MDVDGEQQTKSNQMLAFIFILSAFSRISSKQTRGDEASGEAYPHIQLIISENASQIHFSPREERDRVYKTVVLILRALSLQKEPDIKLAYNAMSRADAYDVQENLNFLFSSAISNCAAIAFFSSAFFVLI